MANDALISSYCRLAKSVADGYARHMTQRAFVEANPDPARPYLEIKLLATDRLNVRGWRVIYHWPPLRAADGDWFEDDTPADTVEAIIRERLIVSESGRPPCP